MTDNRTTELQVTELLRELLDERGVEHEDYAYVIPETQERCEVTRIKDYAGRFKARFMSCNTPGKVDVSVRLTPEQAIAATLDDGEYEVKMDALLSRLTNGKFSKSRAYDLDFMESCVNEEFEELYAKELADATLGNGTLTAEQVREAIESRFDFDVWVPPARWQAIADELNAELRAKVVDE